PYSGGGHAGGPCWGTSCGAHAGPSVPGVQGPYGQPVAMAAAYSYSPPSGKEAAMDMLQNSVPLNMVQQVNYAPGADHGSGFFHGAALRHAGVPLPGGFSPPAVPLTPGSPSSSSMHLAGGGPSPVVPAVGALNGGGMPSRYAPSRTEVRFGSPTGMKVSWYTGAADGKGGFGMGSIDVPGRYNFVQGAIYRLKLSGIPGRPTLELYPTLEVVPVN